MEITRNDFDLSLDEKFEGVNSGNAFFLDSNGDRYTIRFQRQAGILAGSIDCICRLNGDPAWQVNRTWPRGAAVGRLLLAIASAPAGLSAAEFFSED